MGFFRFLEGIGKKETYIVYWNGSTVTIVSHTELALFVPHGEREDDDNVVFEADGGLKEADCQLGLIGRFVVDPKMP